MLVADEFGGAKGVVADGSFVTGKTKGACERGESVGVVVDQQQMGFARLAVPF